MANLKHIGEGKKLLLQLLAKSGPNVKHWMNQQIKPSTTPPIKPAREDNNGK